MKKYKLIDPSYGRIVTFQVDAEEPIRSYAIGLLTAIADGKNIKANISGNVVTLTFSDATLAEAFRSNWKN